MDLGDNCPEEILKLILSYIDCRPDQYHASLVCRRWHQLLADPRTHPDENIDAIEIFQRSVLDPLFDTDRYDETALGRSLRRVKLEDISSLTSYPDYVASCNKLILHGIDFDTISKSARIFQSLDSRLRSLELRLFDDMALHMDVIEECFPNLESLTLRSGYVHHVVLTHPLNVALPGLKNVSLHRIRPEEGFSLSPERLDYVSDYSKYLWDLEHLSALPTFSSLTYLSLGCILFDKSSFDIVLLIIRDDLPQLAHLKISECSFIMEEDFYVFDMPRRQNKQASALKTFEFSRFFLEPAIDRMTTAIAGVFAAKLELVIINLIASRHPAYEGLYEIIPALYRGNCALDLRIEDEESYCDRWGPPPVDSADILVRLEFARVPTSEFISRQISCGTYSKLTRLIFDQCDGLVADHLETIAQSCPVLEDLQVLKCKQLSGRGFLSFLRFWNVRKSRLLRIHWTTTSAVGPDDLEEPDDFDDEPSAMERLYISISKESELLKDKRLERVWKRKGDCRISVWDKLMNTEEKFPKALIIRDYACGLSKVERFSIP